MSRFDFTKCISKEEGETRKQALKELLHAYRLDKENLSEKGKENLITLLILERDGNLDYKGLEKQNNDTMLLMPRKCIECGEEVLCKSDQPESEWVCDKHG